MFQRGSTFDGTNCTSLLTIMPISSDVSARLLDFHRNSHFAVRGGIVTDLDGTAVHERDGRIYVAEPVAEGLKALVELGRPVVLNTLRFPLNVIQTFGREWSSITAEPVPLVSLNGSVLGLLTPTDVGETTFEELVAFPLSNEQLEETVRGLEKLLADGVDNIVLFHYARDWREGEIIWTPRPEREDALRNKYLSASRVHSAPLPALHDLLLSQGATMLSVLADIPEDRRMAYQHTNPNRVITAAGVDKLSGAREAAARLGFDLDQSVGAGDTPMDNFLSGVALAFHVGPLNLDFRGRNDTIRLGDPFQLGTALFELAALQRAEPHIAGQTTQHAGQHAAQHAAQHASQQVAQHATQHSGKSA